MRPGWTLRVLALIGYLFLWSPLIVVVIISFDTSRFLAFPAQGFTFANYAKVFAEGDFLSGFLTSLLVGAIVAVAATACGTLAALALRRRPRGSGAVIALLTSPLVVPHVVLGLALLMVFSQWRLTDSVWGIVLAHAVITLPYTFRSVMASLETADVSSENAARVLGAGPLTVVRRVTLPLLRPGVTAALIFGFLVSFDESVISLFISGRHTTTLPVELLNYVEVKADPTVAALSVLLVLLSIIVMVVVNRILDVRKVLRA
ncbi:ABC transporter permease [Pseudoclavibacter sp. CFCC 13611]|nr:ABC transporter permease [Pseudoclavibacter sp. CFCC 13611]